jgi:cytoskeleton protein RodZ
MAIFGERLRREREMRGITLEQISEHTKISTRNLRALETETFKQLPGGIFNKGFVRAYAKYLGINEEEAVADFLAAEAEASGSKNGMPNDGSDVLIGLRAAEEARAIGTAARPEDQGARFIAIAVVIAVALGVGGFAYKTFSAPPNASIVQASVKNAAPESAAAATPPSPAKQVTEESLPAHPDVTHAPAIIPSPIELSSPEAFKLSLQIHAREESWIQVKADGKVLLEGILSPSSNRSFAAEKELVIKLGNAAGVELSYNGQALPAFDPESRTRTLTFTPEGMRQ